MTGDPRFAYDCYRRFVAMYGEIVMGVASTDDEDENPFARIASPGAGSFLPASDNRYFSADPYYFPIFHMAVSRLPANVFQSEVSGDCDRRRSL